MGVLIYNIYSAIKHAATKSQKKKIPLYSLSLKMLYGLMGMMVIYVVVPFLSELLQLGDFLIDVTVFITVCYWFAQRNESIQLYLDNRFI